MASPVSSRKPKSAKNLAGGKHLNAWLLRKKESGMGGKLTRFERPNDGENTREFREKGRRECRLKNRQTGVKRWALSRK